MKSRIFQLLKIYVGFVLLFIVQKPLFMLYHYDLFREVSLSEWGRVMLHGLPLDFSMAGYLTLIPVVLLLIAIWMPGRWVRKSLHIYVAFINIFLAVIFVSDLELYTHWGFRLDATPLFYLSSPSNAMASVPTAMLFLVPVMIVICWATMTFFLKKLIPGVPCREFNVEKKRFSQTLLCILILGVLFIPIRGGFTVSTMNIGKVYYSADMVLNHAAINPAFSLFTSLTKQTDFSKQYRFMEEEKASDLFTPLQEQPADTLVQSVLKTDRPNIILIVLESFSGVVTGPLGGDPNITPNLNALFEEGIGFTNFYANSFRTDRGLVSLLSGYPAQPTTSIMKYPSKTQSLPSISGSLRKAGYDLTFLYGGDADFTNMRSYFRGAGFDRIISDRDFPVGDRLSKWGVNDEKTFSYLLSDIRNHPREQEPFFKMFLTLSSHEPFDVPFRKFEDPYLNSVAYTDSCLGAFIGELKQMPVWENTLVVLLPDHCMRYPYDVENHDPVRFHIPMVWAGGALQQSKQVDRYGSQIDLAATLLSQLNLSDSAFTFSKNLLNPHNRDFAFYTFKDGFGMLDQSGTLVFDCESKQKLIRNSPDSDSLENSGKAFLQCLYDDLGRR